MRKHKRSLLLALLLCCVSVVAMAGIYRRESKQKDEVEDLVELSEAGEDEAPSKEEVSALVEASLDNQDLENASGEKDELQTQAPETLETEIPQGEPVPVINGEPEGWDEPDSAVSEAMAEVTPAEEIPQAVLHFGTDSVLTWPVQGDVLMEYSMDRTVYFNTLDQYKYSPGILIRSEEGTMVYAGGDALITEISQSDELGCTVTMDLGDSYTVKYGQLKALNVAEGDHVSAGTVIGLVAAPTKYFSLEGDHVYMELDKEGQPVDPLDYLD